MLYTIYQVTHIESGKYYIGKHQTLNPNDGYMGSGQLIRRAVKKYGLNAFRKEVLHVFETECEMNAKEAELVTDEFCLREDTYNLCPGGQGGWGYINEKSSNNIGWKHNTLSKTHQINGGLKSKGVMSSQFVLAGKSSFTGKKHSETTKTKIAAKNSLASKGKNNSQFGSIWITDGARNQKISKTSPIPTGWTKGRTIITLS